MGRVLRQQLTDAGLFFLAVFAGIAVAVTHRWQDNRPSDEAMGSLIPALAESQPHGLVLRRNGRSVRIVNATSAEDSPHWLVESPWKRSADDPAVDGVTTALRDMQVVRRVQMGPRVTATDLARLGLDQPLFTWEAEIDGGVWSVAFGAQAPSPRSGTYVDVTPPGAKNHQFYVVSTDLAKLSLEPEQLVDPRILPYIPSDFGTLTLQSGVRRAQFDFDDARSCWFEAEPPHYRVSRTELGAFLLQLTTLKAERFLTPADATAKHFTSRGATLTLGLRKSQATIRVEFGGACSGDPNQSLITVSGADGGVACADARSALGALEKGLSDWRDTRVFSLRPDEIESISAGENGSALKLERWESSFRMTSGATSRPVDLDTGNQLLSEVVSAHGSLTDPTPSGLAAFDEKYFILLRSSAVGSSDHYEERVSIGPPLANGDRYIKRGVDAAILRVPRKQAASLLFDESRLSPPPHAVDAGED